MIKKRKEIKMSLYNKKERKEIKMCLCNKKKKKRNRNVSLQ